MRIIYIPTIDLLASISCCLGGCNGYLILPPLSRSHLTNSPLNAAIKSRRSTKPLKNSQEERALGVALNHCNIKFHDSSFGTIISDLTFGTCNDPNKFRVR